MLFSLFFFLLFFTFRACCKSPLFLRQERLKGGFTSLPYVSVVLKNNDKYCERSEFKHTLSGEEGPYSCLTSACGFCRRKAAWNRGWVTLTSREKTASCWVEKKKKTLTKTHLLLFSTRKRIYYFSLKVLNTFSMLEWAFLTFVCVHIYHDCNYIYIRASVNDFLPGCLFAVVIKCFMIGVNV